MKQSKPYKSGAFAAIHETAVGMNEAGIIDKQTMRSFDESCLTPIREFTPEEIRALREREEVGQPVASENATRRNLPDIHGSSYP
jgi:putative transcriptional regulator